MNFTDSLLKTTTVVPLTVFLKKNSTVGGCIFKRDRAELLKTEYKKINRDFYSIRHFYENKDAQTVLKNADSLSMFMSLSKVLQSIKHPILKYERTTILHEINYKKKSSWSGV